MKTGMNRAKQAVGVALVAVLLAGIASSQTPPAPYQPKYHGDPARSESEALALGYMRTVLRAQHTYKTKNNDKYATTLASLVHIGSFTKRMTQTQQGDYTVSFHTRKNGKDGKDGFELTMTPNQIDATHRSFYANEDGVIHADEQGAATEASPKA
ncbi:MAG: hypothetical protein ABSE92_01210 [Terriglobales bacterium]